MCGDLLAAEGGEGGDEQLVLGGVDAGGRATSSVSSGWIGTAAVASTGPSSTPSSGTRWTITPVRGALAGERLLPGPLDGAGAGQLAGQRRVQVDDAVGEPAEEAHREDAHPAGEDDEVGPEAGDDVGEAGVVVGPRLAGCAGDVHGRDAGRRRRGRAPGVVAVGDDGDDLGRQPAVGGASMIACRFDPLPDASTTRRAVRGSGPAWFDARRPSPPPADA